MSSFYEEERYRTPFNAHDKTCQVCDQSFPNSATKRLHFDEIHRHRFYRCILCQKLLASRSEMWIHEIEHNRDAGETFFTAEYKDSESAGPSPSESAISRKQTHVTHPKTIHRATLFKCSHCGVKTGSKRRLACHIKRCKSSFKNRGVKIKSNERHASLKKDSLKRLLSWKKKKMAATHKCQSCGKIFPRAAPLEMHVEEVHRGRRAICSACGKLQTLHLLKRHIAEDHFNKGSALVVYDDHKKWSEFSPLNFALKDC